MLVFFTSFDYHCLHVFAFPVLQCLLNNSLYLLLFAKIIAIVSLFSLEPNLVTKEKLCHSDIVVIIIY